MNKHCSCYCHDNPKNEKLHSFPCICEKKDEEEVTLKTDFICPKCNGYCQEKIINQTNKVYLCLGECGDTISSNAVVFADGNTHR